MNKKNLNSIQRKKMEKNNFSFLYAAMQQNKDYITLRREKRTRAYKEDSKKTENRTNKPLNPGKIETWEQIPKTKWKGLKMNENITEKFKRAQKLKKAPALITLEKLKLRIENEISFGKQISPIKDIINLCANKDIIRISMAKLRGNKGALTPGTTGSTADTFAKKQINIISTQIKKGTYKWNPTKRIKIPKPGKKEKRPLGLPDFRDKVTQGAILIILEAIYEPIFEKYQTNFGFRPKKDPNKAIENIKTTGKGCRYAIEGDIKGAYNNVNHGILIKILREHIKDNKFMRLIASALKAGIMENNIYQDSFLGIPQGGICSPILFNIYMHKFDQYITNNIETEYQQIIEEKYPKKRETETNLEYERKRTLMRNSEKRIQRIKTKGEEFKNIPPDNLIKLLEKEGYTKKLLSEHEKINTLYEILKEKIKKEYPNYNIGTEKERNNARNRIYMAKKRIKTTIEQITTIEQKEKIYQHYIQDQKETAIKADRERRELNSLDLDNLKLKISYTRYADDWILLIRGNRENAEILRDLCKNYLEKELKLELSKEKTKITNIHEDKALFLGYEIYYQKNPLIVNKSNGTRARTKGNIQFQPDTKRLENKFMERKYMDKTGKPREIGFLTILEDHEIIEKYNQFLRGLGEYYIRNISCPSRLNRWIYILYFSCIKTLATKHRKTTKKIISEYGYKDISIPEKRKKIPATDYRIIAKYKIDDKERYSILLNYKSLMHTLLITREYYRQNKELEKYETKPTIDFLTLHKINFRTKFKSHTTCTILGCQNPAECTHHIKKLRHSGGRYEGYKGFDKIIASLGRKQIEICKNCHENIHAGKYDGLSLNDIYDIRLIAPESLLKFSEDPKEQKDPEEQESLKDYRKRLKFSNSYILDHKNKTYLNESLKIYLKEKKR